MIENLAGLDINTWRWLTVIGALAALVLYVYRVLCIMDLMRSRSEALTSINRLIYAGLIIVIPMGIGAWLYEYVEKKIKVSLLFIIPFTILILTFSYGMYYMITHGTKFNFDYMGW